MNQLITHDARHRMIPSDRAALAALVDKAAADEPSDFADVRALAIGYLVLGSHEQALQHLDRALELADIPAQVITVWLSLADTYRYAGDTSTAEQLYHRALDLARQEAPEQLPLALQHLGLALGEQGRLDAARELLTEALAMRQTQGDPELVADTHAAVAALDDPAFVLPLPPSVAALLGPSPSWSGSHEGLSGTVSFVNDAYYVKRGTHARREHERLTWLAAQPLPMPESTTFTDTPPGTATRADTPPGTATRADTPPGITAMRDLSHDAVTFQEAAPSTVTFRDGAPKSATPWDGRSETASRRNVVPEVAAFEDDVLVLADAGVPSLAASPPSDIGTVMGRLLRALHSLPVAACPFDERLDVQLSRARRQVIEGLVDPEDFDSDNLGLTPTQILDRLIAERPAEEDLVVSHGDYTPSNVLNGGILIDLGRLGVADRYRDLALAERDLQEDFGEQVVNAFFASYGLTEPDLAKLAYYRLLDELF